MAGDRGVALVGAGYWGRRLARNVAAADGAELRAVCDLDPARAGEVADAHASTVARFDDVLHDAEVELVAIATPAATHAELVGRALDADRHVLVEKPLATSVVAAAALSARASDRGLMVMCDQTYRCAPVLDALRALLAARAFGPLRRIESVRTNRGHEQPDVDVFWDLAYHDLAILDAVVPGGLLARLEVRATSADPSGRGRAHEGHLTLTWPDGLVARVTVDWHAAAKVRTMQFASDVHRIDWDDVRGPHLESDGVGAPVDAGTEPLAAVVAEALAAIAERRAPSCGPAQELPILAVLEAASRSAAHDGEPVVVDLATGDATDPTDTADTAVGVTR